MHGIFLCLVRPHSYNKPLNIVDVTSYTKRHGNNPIFGIFSCIYNIFQILDRISLQYAPNANERKTQTKRTKNERTLHTNDTKNARYTKRTHDTRTNERNQTNGLYGKRKRTNARYTKRTNNTRNERMIHERTNHWSVTIYYPMTNDSGSIEVQYSIVLLFE